MLITITPNPVLDKTITVPQITFNEVLRAVSTREDFGGKGFNVSRALKAMGMESLAMGFIGGTTGRKLEKGLENLGIATDMVTIDAETRTNIVISAAESEHYIKVNEAGPPLHPKDMRQLFERIKRRVKHGDLCALCGSLPPGVPDDFYAELIILIQNCGAKTFLDTSGMALQAGLAARPFLVKPNAEEAAVLAGHAVSSVADAKLAAELLLDAGASMVALSLGGQGMVFAEKRDGQVSIIHAVPPIVKVANPTGAGDALLAGVMFAFEKEMSMKDAVRWGVASGTAAAMHEGVSVGTYEEIHELVQRIDIHDTGRLDG